MKPTLVTVNHSSLSKYKRSSKLGSHEHSLNRVHTKIFVENCDFEINEIKKRYLQEDQNKIRIKTKLVIGKAG